MRSGVEGNSAKFSVASKGFPARSWDSQRRGRKGKPTEWWCPEQIREFSARARVLVDLASSKARDTLSGLTASATASATTSFSIDLKSSETMSDGGVDSKSSSVDAEVWSGSRAYCFAALLGGGFPGIGWPGSSPG